MRVLMATPRFLPEIGGVELHVERLSKRLVQRGASVTVLTTGLERGLPSRDRIGDVDVIRVRAIRNGRDFYAAPGIYTEIKSGLSSPAFVRSTMRIPCSAPGMSAFPSQGLQMFFRVALHSRRT